MSQSMNAFAARNALHVLVVEDDPLQRWILGEHLRDLGVGAVHEAADGAEALSLFQQRRFDLAITDLNMPGMDGIGLLRALAALRWQCPVAVTSALDDDLLHLVEAALAESDSRLLAVLAKPIDSGRLEALVDQTLASAQVQPAADRRTVAVDTEDLRQALAAKVFLPYFQPKIDLATGAVVGVESLARWPHPTRGWIAPSDFIPPLEADYGIVELTMLLLRKVCASLKRFEGAGFPLKVAINLSRALFSHAGVVEQIIDIVTRQEVAPSRLILEITETAVDREPGNMLASLARLKMQGFQLSIDDFGTGYSSMQALTRVPFDELKIDRSFVTGATRNPRSRIILEATVQLAARLGQTTVAEGVETQEELDLLTAAGCRQVQGYFYSRPLPETDFLDWLRRHEAVALA